MSWKDIGYAIAILIISAWTVYKELQRLKQRTQEQEYELDPNPKRCREHGEDISAIKARLDGIDERLNRIENRIK